MKLLLKSAVIAFSAIGIVLSLHTISYAADSSTANIANAPDITSGNSATTDNDTAHNIGITVSVNNNGSPEEQSKSNQIFLDGYVCKPPIYRKTPLGREIADILVAVNRPYGKSDYIPCIAWGRNARFAGGLEVGSHLQICGRVQSREYTKKVDEESVEKRVAYEVSVSKIDLVEEE